MASIIHQIFADNKDNFIAQYKPHGEIIKVLNHIASCRTPELGAAVYSCECGEKLFAFHSCRDRHCPVCQGLNNARWADKQLETALPVKYFHVVFTLPDSINPLIRSFPKQAYNALFFAASSALLKLCADPKYLNATPGFTAVLHTWGQTMQFHPHLHVIITAGGLSSDGSRFIDKSDSRYLLPVKALAKLFRGIFLDALGKAVPILEPLKSSLYQTDFICYLKEPLERAGNVVKYLARYANRVCISDFRIAAYDKGNNTVTFSYNDNKEQGKRKFMTLHAFEFIRRFLLHVLPKRFMKIRHFGILHNRGKFDRISRCRRLLNSCVSQFAADIKKAFQPFCIVCKLPLNRPAHLSPIELYDILLC